MHESGTPAFAGVTKRQETATNDDHLFCVHPRCGYTARMTQHAPSRATLRLLAAALAITPMLAACAGGGNVKKDTRYVARDVNTLYRAAQDRLDRRQYGLAAALFDEVERQHP